MPVVNQRKLAAWVLLSVIGVLGAVCVGSYLIGVQSESLVPAPKTVFHNLNPAKGVTIPFQHGTDLIFIKATIDGKSVLCMVDTGSSNMLLGDSDAILGRSLHQEMLAGDAVGWIKTYVSPSATAQSLPFRLCMRVWAESIWSGLCWRHRG